MAMMLWHQPETKYSVAKIIVTFIYELNRYIYCSELNKIPVTLVVESGNVDLTTRVWYKNWQNWKMKLEIANFDMEDHVKTIQRNNFKV